MRMIRLQLALVLSTTALALTGCAGFNGTAGVQSNSPTSFSVKGLHGSVHGGQQPIGLSSLQLYQAGTGYGTGATPLITPGTASAGYYVGGQSGCTNGSCYTGVVSDANGNFTLTGDYSCTSGTQVYLTATGGQPTPTSPNNPAISLMVGLGLCDNLKPTTFLQINEVTTVATVWALAPFMPATPATLPSTIGAPSSNSVGLVNAFADINTLISVASGGANGSSSTVALPSAEIYTIADMLAACVNSSGPSSTGCVGTASNGLFNYAPNADNSTPSDTLSAALNIARNPGRNVPQLIGTVPGIGSAAFQPTIASATDLTLAVTYSGSNISAPSGAAIDASGNVWIANAGSSSVTGLSHTGAILTGAAGFQAGGVNAPTAIAIDTTGDIWVTNGNSTLTELSSVGAALNGSPFSGGGLSTPTSLAFDGLGNVWISNSGNNAISEFSSTGTALSGTSGYTVSGVSAPVGIAINPK
jgi:hypothetical protein